MKKKQKKNEKDFNKSDFSFLQTFNLKDLIEEESDSLEEKEKKRKEKKIK